MNTVDKDENSLNVEEQDQLKELPQQESNKAGTISTDTDLQVREGEEKNSK